MAALSAAGAVGIVSGSGIDLSALLDSVDWEIPFSGVPGLSCATVEGHAGVFSFGACQGAPVLVQRGRRHFYEGISYDEIVRPVAFMAERGVREVVFTCAAGGLVPGLPRGTLMGVESVRTWPFNRWPERPEHFTPRFVPPGCDTEGAYMWTAGPNYETPAEVRAMRRLGGSAVGMSLAPELWRCRSLGLPAGAVAVITNECGRVDPMNHEIVVASAREQSGRLCALLRRYLASA